MPSHHFLILSSLHFAFALCLLCAHVCSSLSVWCLYPNAVTFEMLENFFHTVKIMQCDKRALILQCYPKSQSWWGGGWLPPSKNHINTLGLLGLGLRPFTYCCGMIKIADWQCMFTVLWFLCWLVHHKRSLPSTNCTLETNISLMNHHVTWYGLCIKKSITRAQGRYLHALKYLAAGGW